MGEVRAQVTQHGEHILTEILEALDGTRSLPVPQQVQHAAFGAFRDAGPAETTRWIERAFSRQKIEIGELLFQP